MVRADPLPIVLVVVEDSDDDFDTVREAVEKVNLRAEVWRAETGGEGLALLQKAVPGRPALVLMDLNTPGYDGRRALTSIKTDRVLRLVPVVVFSGSADPRDVGYCYEQGANAYHVKSVRYPDYLSTLTDLISYWLGRVTLATATP